MKVLVTTAFVLEVADYDELAELVEAIEQSSRNNLLAVLERHGKTWADLDGQLEHYGVTTSIAREHV